LIDAGCQSFRGHASAVSNVKFAEGGAYLISIDSNDKSIFLWKYIKNPEVKEVVPENIERSSIRIKQEIKEVKLEMVEAKEVAKVDDYLANKPYSIEIEHSIPSGYKEPKGAVSLTNKYKGNLPEANLSMRYIYGYRSFDTRNNVKWTKGNLILYHTASIAIILDPEKNNQKYFLRHNADIISLAINSIGTIAATGQLPYNNTSPIYVWDIDSKEVLSCLKGFHTKGVKHVKTLITFSYAFHLMAAIYFL